jgi:hypothetical protein
MSDNEVSFIDAILTILLFKTDEIEPSKSNIMTSQEIFETIRDKKWHTKIMYSDIRTALDDNKTLFKFNEGYRLSDLGIKAAYKVHFY